jgi:hypothetical protein
MIVVALWALVFPIQATDLRLVIWATVTVVAVVVSLALGRRARLL